MTSDHEIRPGERRIALPPASDARIRFIGRIRTPWKTRAECPKNVREARERGEAGRCVIEIDAAYAAGLEAIETCTHLWALYWMDRAPRDLIVQAPRHAPTPRGVLALRSPARPNPIAIAAVKLLRVDGVRLETSGLDCLDGTPLVDLKPYLASTDSIAEAGAAWDQAERP